MKIRFETSQASQVLWDTITLTDQNGNEVTDPSVIAHALFQEWLKQNADLSPTMGGVNGQPDDETVEEAVSEAE